MEVRPARQEPPGPLTLSPSLPFSSPLAGKVTAVGVDGCPGGWVGVVCEAGTIHVRRLINLRSFLDLYPMATVVADVPIGLLEEIRPGGRECDMAARKLLGKPRNSSVFSAPARRYLNAPSFDKAKGMSIQCYKLLPKIREVDGVISPDLLATLREGHPEVSFREMAGHPMRYKKKSAAGRLERSETLGHIEDDPLGLVRSDPRGQLRTSGISGVGVDDLFDACVMLWTAMRIVTGTASRIGGLSRDPRGLEMAIWA